MQVAHPFCADVARVTMGGRTGFVDRDGKMAIAPQHEAANDFADGRAPVRVGQRWGLSIRQANSSLILNSTMRAHFRSTWPVEIGRALGYVNREGKYVWTLTA